MWFIFLHSTIIFIAPSPCPLAISITPSPVIFDLHSWFEDATGTVAGRSAVHIFGTDGGETIGVCVRSAGAGSA